MARGDQFLAEVREWIGTPFHPHAAAKGAGCDCKGLLWGAARELGFPEAESTYALDIGYDFKRLPGARLVEGFRTIFDPVEEIRPGRVLLLKWQGQPGHIAIASRREGYAWHAQIEPNAFVKEASLRSLLSLFPLHSLWRWRD